MKDKDSQAKNGPLKASMSVLLKANEVVVAEVDDAVLWNAVFAAISSGSSVLSTAPAAAAQTPVVDAVVQPFANNTPVAEPINKFAKELGVDLDVLVGACDPAPAEPYLRLDVHHWEQMKKELPMRGPKAVAPIVLTASMLCLWARHAGIGVVSQAQAQTVLGTINVRDSNATRGIQGAEWLQARPNGQIVLNPSQVSKAIAIASCFCKQDWSAWKSL